MRLIISGLFLVRFFDTPKDTNISANWVSGAQIELFENKHWVLANSFEFQIFFLILGNFAYPNEAYLATG